MRRVPVGYAVGTKRARRADGDHPRRDTVPEACAMIEITVYPHKRTKRDYANAMNAGLWDVDFNGEAILTKRRDPEHDAARWLRDHGYGGPLQTRGKDGMISPAASPLYRLHRGSGSFTVTGVDPASEFLMDLA